jgi:hypothetical protein
MISKLEWNEVVTIYDNLVEQCDGFARKGKTVPYTSSNGYMFTLINKEGEMGVRLSKEAQEAFKSTHNTTIFKSHGAVMKDYVLIPESLYHETKLLVSTFEESFAFVNSLPQKS